MKQDRRHFLKTAMMAGAMATYHRPQPSTKAGTQEDQSGIPGLFPGDVVSVHRPGTLANGTYRQTSVRAMLNSGLQALTGADSPAEAWRVFFQPGDVVGLKLNGVGRPHVISSPAVVHEIVAGLALAGIPRRDILAYDREKRIFLQAGFDKWLPEGVRWTYGSDEGHPIQLDMEMYDEDEYIEVPLVHPRGNPQESHHRRSYLANFITKDVNKVINLCVLKHHQSAGITLALKNMSHGLVNNVSRSHSSTTLNTCGWFIPAIVDHPIIRERVVLHILDGVWGAYHGGPGGKVKEYMWPHETMYFSTDPVAMDHVGWKVIDEKRAEMGLEEVGKAEPDDDSVFYRMQPEHVEIAGAMGLGVFPEEEINHQAL